MRQSRSFRLALLVLLSVWFGAIAPGHQRGVVAVPGARPNHAMSCGGEGGPGGCDPAGHCPASSTDKHCPARHPTAPGDDPARRCAICQLVSHLQAPSAVEPLMHHADLVATLPWPAPAVAADVKQPDGNRNRGPPRHV